MDLDIIKMGHFIVYKRREGFHIFDKIIVDEQIKEGFSKEDSEYVHIETSGGGNEAVSAQFPRVRAIKIMKKHKGRYVKVVKYIGHDYTQEARSKVAYFSATLANTYYGVLSLIWFKINHFMLKDKNIFASRHTSFCSLGCAWALKKVFMDSFESSGKIVPAHFLDKDKFEVVWEGYLK